MNTVRLVGQETHSGCTIEIHSISNTVIHFRCSRCEKEQDIHYLQTDARGGWYPLECEKCGSVSKRNIQLERFGTKEDGDHAGTAMEVV